MSASARRRRASDRCWVRQEANAPRAFRARPEVTPHLDCEKIDSLGWGRIEVSGI
jgi:hypothetical protein